MKNLFFLFSFFFFHLLFLIFTQRVSRANRLTAHARTMASQANACLRAQASTSPRPRARTAAKTFRTPSSAASRPPRPTVRAQRMASRVSAFPRARATTSPRPRAPTAARRFLMPSSAASPAAATTTTTIITTTTTTTMALSCRVVLRASPLVVVVSALTDHAATRPSLRRPRPWFGVWL
jgi:hypothetical protein